MLAERAAEIDCMWQVSRGLGTRVRLRDWYLSCIFSACFARRLAGPALEGMRKGTDVSIAKQPCDLRNGQVPVSQMAICEVRSKIVQEPRRKRALPPTTAGQTFADLPPVRGQFRWRVPCRVATALQ